MSYGKHWDSTYTGSMYGAGVGVFAVWGYVIANTGIDHAVELNPKLLSATLGTTIAEVEASIAYLCAPDSSSRSEGANGCRLVKSGSFRYEVVNHEGYRTMRNNEDRREYFRIKQQESRARKRVSNTNVKASTHTDTDTDTDTKKDQKKKQAQAPIISKPNFSTWPSEPSPQVLADWLTLRKRKRADTSATAMSRIGAELHKAAAVGFSVDDCLAEAIARGWTGIKADWMQTNKPNGANHESPTRLSAAERVAANNRAAEERERLAAQSG